jgi:aryl-alcohol dehydrogenase-like predicted oxidoreductase
MTQRSVEILIGKLLTDEELRESFQRDPQGALLQLRNQGLEFSSLELQALSSIEPAEVSDLAEVIDPRLQKASLRSKHMTGRLPDTTTLPTMPLGTTGMRITRVGFGAWAIGGGGWQFAWGTQDDAASIAAIRHAIERGINWIDTAAVYGLGHSEEIVAQALRDMGPNDRPYIFTKAGLVWDEHDRAAPPRRIGDPASIRREVEASLARLGVERIDLYQMHWPPDDGTPLADYWGALLRLKAEGKVRAVGLSNHTVAQLEAAEPLGHVDTLQPPFSAIRREVAAAERPWCAAHGTGLIVYSPMQSGLLTGTFSVERAAQLGADDWRSRAPDFAGVGLRRNLALADALRPIAERHGTSVAAVAVAWTLAWPGVTGAIVGARSPAQVDGWIGAASLELSDADLDDVAAAIQRSGAGTGPVRP